MCPLPPLHLVCTMLQHPWWWLLHKKVQKMHNLSWMMLSTQLFIITVSVSRYCRISVSVHSGLAEFRDSLWVQISLGLVSLVLAGSVFFVLLDSCFADYYSTKEDRSPTRFPIGDQLFC
jgi:hypothetical protein